MSYRKQGCPTAVGKRMDSCVDRLPACTSLKLEAPSTAQEQPFSCSREDIEEGHGGREGEGWGAKGAAPLGRKGGEGDVGDSSAAP